MKHPQGFYVGYLPTPAGHARFLRLLVPTLTLGLIALAWLIAAGQRDPGDARWETGDARAWTGTLVALPHPMLVEDDGSALLLVEVGKRGPRAGLGALHGRRVALSGWLLQRDGRRMIELEPGHAGAADLGPATGPLPALTIGRERTLGGEILDAKCYLGAMKPGDGRAHKACATLCIQGGVPPMLFSRDPDGAATCYLLVAQDGGATGDDLLPLIGEPVTVRGRVGSIGSVPVLAVEPGAVTRR